MKKLACRVQKDKIITPHDDKIIINMCMRAYCVKWNNPEISIFMKKPSIRTRGTLFLHSKSTKTTHTLHFLTTFFLLSSFLFWFISFPFDSSYYFSRVLILFSLLITTFRIFNMFLISLLFFFLFLFFFFPFFSFSFKPCTVGLYLHDLEILTELKQEARDFMFIRIIRNEWTF